jgi:hypothetical protein
VPYDRWQGFTSQSLQNDEKCVKTALLATPAQATHADMKLAAGFDYNPALIA